MIDQPRSEETVGPLERGLRVLRIIAGREGATRPAELAKETGLARSTIDRVATTLTRLGYLRTEDRDLQPAPRLLDLGDAYLTASGIADPLAPHARRLAERLDESVSLAVPDGDGVRFISQTTRRRAMSLSFRIGDLLPAERCAPGALFAADWDERDWAVWRRRLAADPRHTGFPAVPDLPAGPGAAPEALSQTGPETPAGGGAAARDGSPAAQDGGLAAGGFAERVAAARTAGYAVDDQLIEPGLVAVAVPVTDPAGRPVAALSVVSHTSRHTAADLLDSTLGELRAAAARMTGALAEAAGGGGTTGGAAGKTADVAAHGTPAAAGRPGAVREPAAPAGYGYSPADKADLGPEFLQSLARGLAVLTALGRRPGGLTLSAAAEATGLPRATARRSLLTLRQLGYVEYLEADGRRFRPLPRVLELGYARMAGLGFPEIAGPHLAELSARLGESTSVAVLDGDDIRYVARVPTRRIMSVNITIGTRFPAHATSMGRVLLAGLPAAERAEYFRRVEPRALTRRTVTDPDRLRELVDRAGADGSAVVDQELEDGLRSVAVPLRDRTGRVTAALNVSLHAGRPDSDPEEDRRQMLPELLTAAALIEADAARVTRRAAD
ncbi:IclR family transcriptional regulator domain-containing protein [Phaeacidiphilus oryzae]|uniref:IclR family transcriptional regulator domain-containing protein n=1 Tax=Phaeacidiphilus oryzae TaxID=348818 RepID=UPI00055C8866|nr:IclR family transcriptional regulator C-terminal domain-containing protein [Phaeacidiphilus oryzae]